MEFTNTDSTNQSKLCEGSEENRKKLLEACGLLKEVQDNNKIKLENTKRRLDEYEEQEKEMAAKFQSLCGEEMVCKEKLERKLDKYTRREECLKDSLSKLNRIINQAERATDDLL